MRIRIKEGNSGILSVLREDGSEESFYPDCDLEETDRILDRFYGISRDGIGIRDSFREGGINWFPTTMALLYWQYLYIYVKYRRFIEQYPLKDHEYVFLNEGNLAQFVSLLQRSAQSQTLGISHGLESLKHKLSAWLVGLHNRRICRRFPKAGLLFFRLSLNDFRSTEQKKTLEALGIPYLETVTYSNRQVIGNLLAGKPRPLFFLIQLQADRALPPFSLPPADDPLREWVFRAAARAVQGQIDSFQKNYRFYKRQLRGTSLRCLYGIDYTHVIYPLIYACQALGMKTIGHQHGNNYGPYDAPYIMKGFGQGEYRWFDTILVWGDYWRERVYRYARCYATEQIKVGTSMRPVLQPTSAAQVGDRGRKNVLFPSEEITDTHAVGLYMIALQDLGYHLYLKLRPDEDAGRQIQAYCLPPDREKQITCIDRITEELMAEIDIVAGTYSTVIYELLPFQKTSWYLSTKFAYAEDMVGDGIAKRIRLETIEEDIRQVSAAADDKLAERVCSPEPLYDVLKRELCPL